MTQTFNELGLSTCMLEAVEALAYQEPTPVQAQAIPAVLAGKDVVASAKTGTGKTAAFSLPLLDRYVPEKGNHGPHVLIVTPTRELAQQIAGVCETIAHKTHHRILAVVGGVSIEPQIAALKRGIDVLIATPGRLLDLMEQQALHLGSVQALVLDEADRMLDMGFWPSVRRIIAATPTDRQTLLFSATLDASIEKTVGRSLRNPVKVAVATCGDVAETIEQYLLRTPQEVKPELLRALLKERGSKRVIVFARTRSRADSCVRRLKRAGFSAEAIHSDRTQNQRQRALANFSSGKTGILVATDVLARGIDVTDVAYVVNYDLPMQAEDYVHRVGRTGRAGQEGFSVSFVTPDGEEMLHKIEQLTHEQIPELTLTEFDMEDAKVRAAERAQRREAAKDPDIQAAKREMAQREKAKGVQREKAKAQASRSGVSKSSKQGSRRKSKAAPQVPVPMTTAGKRPVAAKNAGAVSASTGAKSAGMKNTGTVSAGAGTKNTHAKSAHEKNADVKNAGARNGDTKNTSAKSATGKGTGAKGAGVKRMSTDKRSKTAVSASTSKRDVRPGCSRRAAIAQQRERSHRTR